MITLIDINSNWGIHHHKHLGLLPLSVTIAVPVIGNDTETKLVLQLLCFLSCTATTSMSMLNVACLINEGQNYINSRINYIHQLCATQYLATSSNIKRMKMVGELASNPASQSAPAKASRPLFSWDLSQSCVRLRDGHLNKGLIKMNNIQPIWIWIHMNSCRFSLNHQAIAILHCRPLNQSSRRRTTSAGEAMRRSRVNRSGIWA